MSAQPIGQQCKSTDPSLNHRLTWICRQLQGKTEMRRFGLRTLFVMVLLSATGVYGLKEYWRALPPIQTPYSSTELQQTLSSGRPVLVTVDAAWSMNPSGRPRFMSAEVSRRLRRANLVAMRADWTTKTPAVDTLMASLNQNIIPALVLYSPSDPTNPTVLTQQASELQILSAIDAVLEN
jgi:thiol:disulfide interchange protein